MNTNIPLSARMFKQKPLMESYGDAMSLKNMANRGQMQEMQMQEYQQSQQDQMRFKDLVRQANGDPQKLLAAQSEIDPIGGMQAQAEYAGTQADNETKQLDLALKKNQALFQILTSSRDPQSYQAALQEAARLLGPDVIAKAPKEYNPEFVKQMAIQSLDLDKQIKAALDERKQTADEAAQTETGRHNLAMENKQPTNLAARPTTIMKNGKPVVIDANTGAELGEAPAGVNKPLSATAQKELFEAEDIAESGDNAISILKSILEVNPESGKSQNDIAYSGGFAEAKLKGAEYIPGSSPEADASVDLKNKVTGQALESLRAIFGGMPTEGERKILIELQGALNMTPAQRKAIFERAIDLAEKRVKFNREKSERLRKGEYFSAQPADAQDSDEGWTDVN